MVKYNFIIFIKHIVFKYKTNLDFKLPDSFLKSESELVITSSWFTCDAFVFFRLFYMINISNNNNIFKHFVSG